MNGIGYTKQHICQMVWRVERGLPLVPTPEEEAELKWQATQLREEDKAELTGIMDENEDGNKDDHDDDDYMKKTRMQWPMLSMKRNVAVK